MAGIKLDITKKSCKLPPIYSLIQPGCENEYLIYPFMHIGIHLSVSWFIMKYQLNQFSSHIFEMLSRYFSRFKVNVTLKALRFGYIQKDIFLSTKVRYRKVYVSSQIFGAAIRIDRRIQIIYKMLQEMAKCKKNEAGFIIFGLGLIADYCGLFQIITD